MSALQQAMVAASAASPGLPPGVAPAIMSSASLWINAIDAAFLYKDTSGTNVTTNGDDIATARDANGLARLLKATDSAGAMPDYLVADTVSGFSVLSSINSNGTSNSPMHGYTASSPGSGIPTGSTLPVSSIITASAMTWCGAIYLNNASSDNSYSGDFVWTDAGGYVGLICTNGVAFVAYSWNGGSKAVQSATVVGADTWVIVSMKHESGALKIRINGGAWDSIACGNVDDVSGALKCFTRYSGPVGHPELKTPGMAWWGSAISDADLLDAERYFGGLVGVSI